MDDGALSLLGFHEEILHQGAALSKPPSFGFSYRSRFAPTTLVPKLQLRHGALSSKLCFVDSAVCVNAEQRSRASKTKCVPKLELGNEGSLGGVLEKIRRRPDLS
jgi:hypothetical protein